MERLGNKQWESSGRRNEGRSSMHENPRSGWRVDRKLTSYTYVFCDADAGLTSNGSRPRRPAVALAFLTGGSGRCSYVFSFPFHVKNLVTSMSTLRCVLSRVRGATLACLIPRRDVVELYVGTPIKIFTAMRQSQKSSLAPTTWATWGSCRCTPPRIVTILLVTTLLDRTRAPHVMLGSKFKFRIHTTSRACSSKR